MFNRLTDLVNKLGIVPTFFFSGNNLPRAQVRVAYTAGTVGYADFFDTKGTDRGILDVSLRDPAKTLAQGEAKLTFTYTVAAVISGPSSVTGGSSISLNTSASNYRTPLTYKWWKNGTLMSGVTWPSFTTTGPSTGTSVTYKVEMTDADGDKGTDTHVISGTSGSTGGGGGGGGCVIIKADSTFGRPVQGETTNQEMCPIPP